MKQGVIILKPDFFEYGEEIREKLKKLMLENGLQLSNFCEIPDYGTFCEQYRLYDITNSNYTEEEAKKELLRTSYATFVYKSVFRGKSAIALVFEDENAEELYKKMSDVKTGIRNYIKKNKKKEYYVDTSTEWRAFEYIAGRDISQEYIDSDTVKLAYLNGIHLEEKDLFDRDICYKFLKKEGIIDKGKAVRKNEEYDI